jgi:hypothetical protein
VETNRRPRAQKKIGGQAAESGQGITRFLRGANHCPRTGCTDSGGNGLRIETKFFKSRARESAAEFAVFGMRIRKAAGAFPSDGRLLQGTLKK